MMQHAPVTTPITDKLASMPWIRWFRQLVDRVDEIKGTADAPAWDSITGKPDEFTPETHTHPQYIETETDPTVPAHVKDITEADIVRWDEANQFVTAGGCQVAGVTGGALGDLVYIAGVQPGDVSYEDIHGITYKCVQMPDGNKWMAENYRKLVSYVQEPGGPPPDSYTGNVPDYGYLYRRDLAEDFRNDPVVNGWQFPTRAEWLALAAACGGLSVAGGHLKTAGTTRWSAPNAGGADDYGFNAVGAGYHTPFYNREGFRTNGVYWCADFDTVPGGKHCVGFTTGSAAMTDGSGLTGYRDDAAIMAVSIRWKKASSLVAEEFHVPAFRVRLFDDAAFLTLAEEFDIPAQEIPVPGYDQRYYLCAQRSGSTVSLVSVPQSDVYTINMSNIVPLWRFEIHGTELHQISYDNMGDGLPNKQEFAQLRTEPYRMAVEGGFAVTLGAGRSLTMTGAEVFFGHYRISVLAFDSATDTVHDFYHVAGVWDDTETVGGWAWPNTQYDDGTNLVTMGNNKWSALYVYRSIGDDKELFVVYAQGEANTLESARLIGIPPTPALVQWHSMLVGRILFQKSAATGIFEPYQPATFVRAEAPSLALNDLTDVDTAGAVTGDILVLQSDGIWRPQAP